RPRKAPAACSTSWPPPTPAAPAPTSAGPGKPATPRTAPATSPANSTANPPPAPSPAARDAPVGAGQQRYLTATHGQLADQASPPSARPRRGSRHSRVTPEGASFEVWTVLGEQRPGKMPHLQGAADVRPVRVNGGWRNASISSPSASTKPTNANTK